MVRNVETTEYYACHTIDRVLHNRSGGGFFLYSSRTKGRWSQMPYVAARAPEGWRESHTPDTSAQDDTGFEPLDDGEEVTVDARNRAWARLLAKVYEVDPLVCPKCGSEMRVIAVIQDPVEIRDILAHLVQTGRAPPGFDPALMN